MMPALTHGATKPHSLFYAHNPPTIKPKHNSLTQLTLLKLNMLKWDMYAEIRQAHIVVYFFVI